MIVQRGYSFNQIERLMNYKEDDNYHIIKELGFKINKDYYASDWKFNDPVVMTVDYSNSKNDFNSMRLYYENESAMIKNVDLFNRNTQEQKSYVRDSKFHIFDEIEYKDTFSNVIKHREKLTTDEIKDMFQKGIDIQNHKELKKLLDVKNKDELLRLVKEYDPPVEALYETKTGYITEKIDVHGHQFVLFANDNAVCIKLDKMPFMELNSEEQRKLALDYIEAENTNELITDQIEFDEELEDEEDMGLEEY